MARSPDHAIAQCLALLCLLLLPGAAWGTAYTVNLTETLTTSDGPVQLLSDVTLPAETLSTADVAAVHTGWHVNLAETLTTSAAVGKQDGWRRGNSVVLVTSDTLQKAITVRLAESLTVNAAIAALGPRRVSLGETLSVTDAVVPAAQGHAPALNETLSTSVGVVTSHGWRRSLADNLSTGDGLGTITGRQRSVAETLSTAAGLGTGFQWYFQFAESLTTSAGILAQGQDNTIDLSESLGTVDVAAVQVATAGTGPTLMEALFTNDTMTAQQVIAPPQAPLPSISLLGDSGLAAAGTCSFILPVLGDNFLPSSVVDWNGSPRPTSYLGPHLVDAIIASSDLTAGTVSITVINPGGHFSQSQSFTVVGAPPTVSASYVVGNMLILEGTNFVPRNTVALWDSTELETTWISPTKVEAALPAGGYSLGGNTVSVSNFGCQD